MSTHTPQIRLAAARVRTARAWEACTHWDYEGDGEPAAGHACCQEVADARAEVQAAPRARKDYGCPLRVYYKPDSLDCYTLIPPRAGRAAANWCVNGLWQALASSARPFDPRGFGQHTTAQAGPHLGKRIRWADLPAEVQRFARLSFLAEYCPQVPA